MNVATTVTPSRRWQADALAESLAEHHPELALDVDVVADEGDMAALARRKPEVLRLALERGGPALYLDADTLVLGDLSPLLDAVAAHDVVLIPHLVLPVGPERELEILRSGTFNAGVVGAGRGGAAFVDWWGAALDRVNRGAAEEGYYYDQRWLDLVPGLFADVCVLRDARFDVGHWNLPEHASADVRLLHLSGYDPADPERVSRHDTRLTLGDLGPLADVFGAYGR